MATRTRRRRSAKSEQSRPKTHLASESESEASNEIPLQSVRRNSEEVEVVPEVGRRDAKALGDSEECSTSCRRHCGPARVSVHLEGDTSRELAGLQSNINLSLVRSLTTLKRPPA